ADTSCVSSPAVTAVRTFLYSRGHVMKKIAVLSAVLFCTSITSAQEPPANGASDSPPDTGSASAPDARMKALEEQVHTLAEQVACVRDDLKSRRDARWGYPAAPGQLLLASSRIEPGTLPEAPAAKAPNVPEPTPPAPQVAQTQTFGGATANAKLLNP